MPAPVAPRSPGAVGPEVVHPVVSMAAPPVPPQDLTAQTGAGGFVV
jgi:hypothetical protein